MHQAPTLRRGWALGLEAGVVGVEGGAGGGHDGHREQLVHVHDLEGVADLGQVGGQVTQAQVLASGLG